MSDKTEKSRFKLHPHMLYQAIMRQAGSLGKAVLEGAMNSIDAKAKRCDIVLDRKSLTMTDDGQGFRSRKEIDEWFEVFGLPQDPDSNKTYGQFRMGRGQLFAFGVNVWRSGTFVMSGIDIKNKGLDYDLTTCGTSSMGCRIEVKLYEELSMSGLLQATREIERLVMYMPSFGIELTLNGKPCGKDARQEKWTFETDDAWVRLTDASNLEVYNLGAYVRGMYVKDMGKGGVVVSKRQIAVNFARNDVMSSCPVWQRIRKEVKDRSGDVKERLTDAEREFVAEQMLAGELDKEEGGEARVFTDVQGRHWSARQLYNKTHVYGRQMSHAKRGDRRGEKLHQQRVAFIMADCTLARFDTDSLKTVIRLAEKYGDKYGLGRDGGWQEVPFSKVSKGMSESCDLLDAKELTATEKIWLSVLQTGQGRIISALNGDDGGGWSEAKWRRHQDIERQLCIGVSESYDAWTDGRKYVAFSRQFLRKLQLDAGGVWAAYAALTHEYCHDDADALTHEHSTEFYQQYHDAHSGMNAGAFEAYKALPRILENAGKGLGRREARLKDRQERREKAMQDVLQAAARVSEKEAGLKGGKAQPAASEAPAAPAPEPPKASGKNPYRGKYGVLFELGSRQPWQREALLAEAAKATGQTEAQVAMALNVLGNERHNSNKGRSRRVEEGGKIRLEAI